MNLLVLKPCLVLKNYVEWRKEGGRKGREIANSKAGWTSALEVYAASSPSPVVSDLMCKCKGEKPKAPSATNNGLRVLIAFVGFQVGN